MRKLLLKLDVTQFNKEKIEPREFTNQNGETVTKKEYPVEVILTDDSKTLKEGDGWNLIKSGFAVEGATKEERENKTKTPYVSDVLEFVDTKQENVQQEAEDPDQDVPF